MKRLRLLAELPPPADEAGWKRLIYRHSADVARDVARLAAARLAAARGEYTTHELQRVLQLAARWRPPAFRLTGRDVVALGVAPGPQVGRLLRQAEERFMAQDFSPPDREGQLTLLRQLVADAAAERKKREKGAS